MAFEKIKKMIWDTFWSVGVGGTLIYLIFFLRVDPIDTGNPMRPKTWEEAEEQRAAGREARRVKRFYLEQVEAGRMSFEEAGCGERGGEWNQSALTCYVEPSPRVR